MKRLIPIIALLLSCGEMESEVNPLVGEWVFVEQDNERLITALAHHYGSRDLAAETVREIPTTLNNYVLKFNADLTYSDSFGADGTWSATQTDVTMSENYDILAMPYVIMDSELVLSLRRLEMLILLYKNLGDDKYSEIATVYRTAMPYFIDTPLVRLTFRRQ